MGCCYEESKSMEGRIYFLLDKHNPHDCVGSECEERVCSRSGDACVLISSQDCDSKIDKQKKHARQGMEEGARSSSCRPALGQPLSQHCLFTVARALQGSTVTSLEHTIPRFHVFCLSPTLPCTWKALAISPVSLVGSHLPPQLEHS